MVSSSFDAAEFGALNHEITRMQDWLAHLDRLILALDAPAQPGAGTVSHNQAVAKAHDEYGKYRVAQSAISSDVEAAYLESIKSTQHRIEGKKWNAW